MSTEEEHHLSDRARELLAYCETHGGWCPQPSKWSRMWRLIPHRDGIDGLPPPPPPPILGAWHHTPPLFKWLAFSAQIEWADRHGAIDEIDTYLRELAAGDWFAL